MNGLPSLMAPQHNFSRVPKVEVPRSSFNRSCGLKTTFDAGYLIPIFWDLVYPGDTMSLNASMVLEQSTMFVQVMDNIYCDTFFFFVPWRLIWSHWKEFNGEQASPTDQTVYSIPQVPLPNTGVVTGTLYDYFGMPVGILATINVNNYLGRCYNRIWQEWFRDENLQNTVTLDTGDGPDTYTNYVLLRRGKRHDYFTSCLPWAQKPTQGATAVTLPLGSSATVKANATELNTGGAPAGVVWRDTAGAYPASVRALAIETNGRTFISTTAATSAGSALYPTNLYADLTNATASTINAWRQALQLQAMYERDARGGTRYYELIKMHFGVTDPGHLVLQRPLYLGGGSTPIRITPVAQTTYQGTPTVKDAKGSMTGYGKGVGTGHGFTHSFTEHGIILGLCSVRADLTYQQGLDREFTYRTRFDMMWPGLCNIGEQAVLNQEIYCDGSGSGGADGQTFGYQERYAEARYKASKITGYLRSNLSAGKTTLDYYHLSQNFGSLPTLGDTFIKDTPPLDRISSVTSAGGVPHYRADFYFDYKCARVMPVYGIPGYLSRF